MKNVQTFKFVSISHETEKKKTLGIIFFSCKMSWNKAMEHIFPSGCCQQCWECLRSRDLDLDPPPPLGRVHQAMGESGLAFSVIPLAIQAPHPRLKILAMTLEKKLRLCESFNAIIIF